MSLSVSKNILPQAPSGLCFSKDEFIKDHFEVDKFLHDCRKRASPETLRDDLRIYLKILQNALVELINNDYADFVNLSSNLAGMDKLISNLSGPLDGFREEILQLQTLMTFTIGAIEVKLREKAEIRKARACLTRLAGSVRSVETIERMLKVDESYCSGSDGGTGNVDALAKGSQSCTIVPLSGQLVERVAGEYNKLLCYLSELSSMAATIAAGRAGVARSPFLLLVALQPRIDAIAAALRQHLATLFGSALQSRSADVLARCLRAYAAIDSTSDAEELFRLRIVRPLCEQIFHESRVQQSIGGSGGVTALTAVYDELLEAVPTLCTLLAEVASGKRGSDAIEGYDFAVNGVWPEVAEVIEVRAPFIFAPGDPDIFLKRYQATLHFVDRFERQCCRTVASVRRLRSHARYVAFMAKWNVPVYFQIRQQEIAASVEAALEVPFTEAAGGSSQAADGVFALHATNGTWQAMCRCWADNVYVTAAAHRFWKLTLQIMARFGTWLNSTEQLKMSGTVRKDVARTSPDDALLTHGTSSSVTQMPITSSPVDSPSSLVAQLMLLIGDSLKLTTEVGKMFEQKISKRLLQVGVSESELDSYRDVLRKGCEEVEHKAEALITLVVEDVLLQSAPHLRLVTDIPRLFRKTNREVPSKTSGYVSSLVKPLADLVHLTRQSPPAGAAAAVPRRVEQQLFSRVLSELSRQYEGIVTEVLTSVKKMEDSLKRLKRGKGTPGAAGPGGVAATTDDDKIRLQIALDIEAFSTKVSEMNLQVEDIPTYVTLREVATAAVASCSK